MRPPPAKVSLALSAGGTATAPNALTKEDRDAFREIYEKKMSLIERSGLGLPTIGFMLHVMDLTGGNLDFAVQVYNSGEINAFLALDVNKDRKLDGRECPCFFARMNPSAATTEEDPATGLDFIAFRNACSVPAGEDSAFLERSQWDWREQSAWERAWHRFEKGGPLAVCFSCWPTFQDTGKPWLRGESSGPENSAARESDEEIVIDTRSSSISSTSSSASSSSGSSFSGDA
ncbi:unnamed protein product [Amoebophrya sp. A120]|nr:unnamed protein product [Amoebophrya sp. A120]|eukprot:GSA120T00000066001.1